jgi:threonylcarbamoyladenosine tRNA methylthiotransferase MtaB
LSTVNCKRASVHTLGCRLNQSESAILEEKLREDGYTLVPFGEPADLAIVNTCTVTNEADTKSRKLVRQFIRNNPGAYTAVIGCYAQMGANTLATIPGVDLIIGNQEKLNVLDYVKAGKNEQALIIRDRIDRDDFLIDFGHEATPLSRRANLKVQDGCDFMCSFCLIPFARGRARAREWDNLLSEARSLVERGAKEIILTGVNIGTYALENRSILHIVDALNTIDGLDRIRISSIEPTTIPGELFDRMNDPDHALLPYLHIPPPGRFEQHPARHAPQIHPRGIPRLHLPGPRQSPPASASAPISSLASPAKPTRISKTPATRCGRVRCFTRMCLSTPNARGPRRCGWRGKCLGR